MLEFCAWIMLPFEIWTQVYTWIRFRLLVAALNLDTAFASECGFASCCHLASGNSVYNRIWTGLLVATLSLGTALQSNLDRPSGCCIAYGHSFTLEFIFGFLLPPWSRNTSYKWIWMWPLAAIFILDSFTLEFWSASVCHLDSRHSFYSTALQSKVDLRFWLLPWSFTQLCSSVWLELFFATLIHDAAFNFNLRFDAGCHLDHWHSLRLDVRSGFLLPPWSTTQLTSESGLVLLLQHWSRKQLRSTWIWIGLLVATLIHDIAFTI